jgi:hypothetical protein
MAYAHTPDYLRNDPEMAQEFPPRPLAGLADGWLTWRSPVTLAQDRDMQARWATAGERC